MQFETLENSVFSRIKSTSQGSTASILDFLSQKGEQSSRRQILRVLDRFFEGPPLADLEAVRDGVGGRLNPIVAAAIANHSQRHRNRRLVVVQRWEGGGASYLLANDRRGERWWVKEDPSATESLTSSLAVLRTLVGKDLLVVPHGALHEVWSHKVCPQGVIGATWAHAPLPYVSQKRELEVLPDPHQFHLASLEAESIRIIREAVAVAKNPAMLFSMGKDSMVMLTLARKAYWPDPIPFPLVMIDTRWKFQEMYGFRQYIEDQPDLDVIVHINPDAITGDINPFDHGSAHHTEVTKTLALKQVLDAHGFDFVFGGARRDEEKSRAKERIFSLRGTNHSWDPKNQRPELWNVYNTKLAPGQSMRVFPISNWTELDVWRYIHKEDIDVVPLYFSETRPFVERSGSLIMVNDDRFRLEADEEILFEPIRFRTLGCYPLTGGVRSRAVSVSEIIAELESSRLSERSSRVIDFDSGSSMEQKKKEGYF
jgi:sulfate adenylyltransferase subunit 2